MKDIKTKVCPDCGEEFPLKFYRRPDGNHETYCNDCLRKKGKERRDRKKEMFKYKY